MMWKETIRTEKGSPEGSGLTQMAAISDMQRQVKGVLSVLLHATRPNVMLAWSLGLPTLLGYLIQVIRRSAGIGWPRGSNSGDGSGSYHSKLGGRLWL